ncbi:hypothetical protein DL98DRAFT_300709 [Cadophora sp. DSE1049]|nr:hypothetical protein DL98DRAFT_300709 [Cadophora sp. DSE1049]
MRKCTGIVGRCVRQLFKPIANENSKDRGMRERKDVPVGAIPQLHGFDASQKQILVQKSPVLSGASRFSLLPPRSSTSNRSNLLINAQLRQRLIRLVPAKPLMNPPPHIFARLVPLAQIQQMLLPQLLLDRKPNHRFPLPVHLRQNLLLDVCEIVTLVISTNVVTHSLGVEVNLHVCLPS